MLLARIKVLNSELQSELRDYKALRGVYNGIS